MSARLIQQPVQERLTYAQFSDAEDNAEIFAESIGRIVDNALSRLSNQEKLIYLDALNGLSTAWSGEHMAITGYAVEGVQLDAWEALPGHKVGCQCADCARVNGAPF